MRATTPLMITVALVGSVGLHLAGFAVAPSPEIQIKGGAPNQMTMLGNSFADMTEGSISASIPSNKAEPVEQETTKTPVNVAEASRIPQPEVTPAINEPKPVKTPQPVTAAAPVIVESRSNPVVPLIETPPAPEPEPAKPPQTLAALAPVPPEVTVTARTPVRVQKATPDTVRPAARPAKPAEPRSSPAPASRKGGEQPAKKGHATGSAAGQAAERSAEDIANYIAAGNAAVANYPGIVMRQIYRARKERAGARGEATVGFKIAASGAVATAHILQSSGSAKIDGIALRHIRRASPFPPPPKGARRNFSVVFVSKR